jgi:hypothetical protein
MSALIGGRLRSQRIDRSITAERGLQLLRGLDYAGMADGTDQFGRRGIKSIANMRLPIGLRIGSELNSVGGRAEVPRTATRFYPRARARSRG